MNIAIEISPLITASGSYGDKSGVYRYLYGLLKSLVGEINSHDPDAQIILFTFAPNLLSNSLNPEILKIIEKKNVTLIGYEKKLTIPKKRENDFIEFFNIPYLKTILKLFDKLFHIRDFYAKMQEKRQFIKYVKELENHFIKLKVEVVLHSETGFYPLEGVKNMITIYDLTTILLPHFHRVETCDLQSRKLRFTKKHCEGVMAISKCTKEDLLYYAEPFTRKKIIVAYPGLDHNFDNQGTHSMDYLNKIVAQYNNKIESHKYFLYYGTFEPRKNLAYVVRAFADLVENKEISHDYKLVMIGGKGWGDVKEMVQNFIKENYPLPEDNPFILMDFINDNHLNSFIKHALAVVYPSIYEGFGLPVLESMAIGTPVISSDTSSLPEVGGDAVLYANPKDFANVKKQMIYLIHNPEMREEYAKKGIEQSKKFNWSETAKQVYSFMKEL
jgi:glycosyltransferase involved in cell wall biosynthesis